MNDHMNEDRAVNADLLAALEEALVTIRALHGEAGWSIYEENAPEMVRIRGAMLKARGEN